MFKRVFTNVFSSVRVDPHKSYPKRKFENFKYQSVCLSKTRQMVKYLVEVSLTNLSYKQKNPVLEYSNFWLLSESSTKYHGIWLSL